MESLKKFMVEIFNQNPTPPKPQPIKPKTAEEPTHHEPTQPAEMPSSATIQRILGPFGHILIFILFFNLGFAPVGVQAQVVMDVSALKMKPAKAVPTTEAEYIEEYGKKATKSGKSFKQPVYRGAALYYNGSVVYTIETSHSADGLEITYDRPIVFIEKTSKKGVRYWTTKTVPAREWAILTAPEGGSK